LSKHPNTPTDVSGSVIIDRAYIKENVLSGTFHKNLLRYTGSPFASYQADTTCDVQISSRVPIQVKTPFLETAVRVNVQVKNTFKDPVVTGSINLLSGFLSFPYRPLYISKGAIYFLPHQLHDPSIELIAKNKIKKYNVGLQVTGSLENHQIALDASPALTDEQIVALLLVGSEEESLNVVMPALIMQNLQTIMFGYDQSSRSIDKIFTSLLKPFNRIHVVPSFSDKTGRGGLRGAIEIDVNDRWRALIQKNFSLTEDTRIEVEYLVSDDISVRAVANERRDVGAEVEMKWKF
jgi:translocation and assembly module TamB